MGRQTIGGRMEEKRFRAEWRQRSGVKTTGVFHLSSKAEVRKVIEDTGGQVISIEEVK